VVLSELATVDKNFANAIKMLIIKNQNDGVAKIPMNVMVDQLNRMGFSAAGQINAIRGLIATFKAKNNNLVADVNNNEIILTTVPSADTEAQAEENKNKVNKDAISQARKDLGI
jgi:hypothetical protein